jgi:hypothetical protein
MRSATKSSGCGGPAVKSDRSIDSHGRDIVLANLRVEVVLP